MPRHQGNDPFQRSLFDEPDRKLRFVFHDHYGPHRHHDLRLECGKILIDFALPDGISCEPGIKVRVIRMHNHNRSLLRLEGVMRLQGQYAGQMVIIDTGCFVPIGDCNMPLDDKIWLGLQAGFLLLELKGERLKGKYILQREQTDWSLTKVDDQWNSSFTPEDLLPSLISGKQLFELDGTPAYLRSTKVIRA